MKRMLDKLFVSQNVAKNLLRLRGFFATLDVHKLIVRQVEVNDGYDILEVFLVFFQHFWNLHWKMEVPRICLQFPNDPWMPTIFRL